MFDQNSHSPCSPETKNKTRKSPAGQSVQRAIPFRFGSAKKGTEEGQSIHIFVDQSNIEVGAQFVRRRPTTRSGATSGDLQINATGLYHRLLSGRGGADRVVEAHCFGSFGSHDDESRVRKPFERAGFKVHMVQRPRSCGEQFVDDAMAGAMAYSVLESKMGSSKRQHTLVLVSGDGNDNHGRISFRKAVDAALAFGWRVEVWGCRHSINHIYRDYASHKYPAAFKVIFLDSHCGEPLFKYFKHHENHIRVWGCPHCMCVNPTA